MLEQIVISCLKRYSKNVRDCVCVCFGKYESESVSCSVYLTLCEPMDCSPPGSSVRGIVQARILEWAAIPFSRGIFPFQGSSPGLLRWRADSSSSEPHGSPWPFIVIIPITGSQFCPRLFPRVPGVSFINPL